MKLAEIYDTALYLAEKTNDSTGFIDDEYKSLNKMKALELIKQAAVSIANIENYSIIDAGRLGYDDELMLPYHLCKFVIPLYVAALLCHHDGEEEKYNLLIFEYQNALSSVKHNEESVLSYDILEGLR